MHAVLVGAAARPTAALTRSGMSLVTRVTSRPSAARFSATARMRESLLSTRKPAGSVDRSRVVQLDAQRAAVVADRHRRVEPAVLDAQLVEHAQRLPGEPAQLGVVALGLQLADHHQRQDDLVLGEAARAPPGRRAGPRCRARKCAPRAARAAARRAGLIGHSVSRAWRAHPRAGRATDDPAGPRGSQRGDEPAPALESTTVSGPPERSGSAGPPVGDATSTIGPLGRATPRRDVNAALRRGARRCGNSAAVAALAQAVVTQGPQEVDLAEVRPNASQK